MLFSMAFFKANQYISYIHNIESKSKNKSQKKIKKKKVKQPQDASFDIGLGANGDDSNQVNQINSTSVKRIDTSI